MLQERLLKDKRTGEARLLELDRQTDGLQEQVSRCRIGRWSRC